MARRLLRLALPIALSNLTVPLTGLVDLAMLGHLRAIRHLAGVALASVLFDYLYWTFGFLRMGTTGLTAQAAGRGEEPEVLAILGRAVLLAGAIAGAILLLQSAIESVGFRILSGAPAVEMAGRAYYRARILGAPAALVNFALIGWFLGREMPGRALVMTVVGNGANILLDYLFIVEFDLESRGAGFATALSQYLMLLVALGFVFRERPALYGIAARMLDRRAFVASLQLNRDILIRTFCLITTFAVFINLSAAFGMIALAANAILIKLLDLAAYGIDGLAFATETLAGTFKGQRDRSSLRALLRLGLIWGELLAGSVILCLFLFGSSAYGLLTSHMDVIDEIRRYEGWSALALVFGAAAYIFDGLYLGLTEGRILRNAMLISTLGCFLPAAIVARQTASIHLLWLALVLFMAARVTTLAARRRVALERAS